MLNFIKLLRINHYIKNLLILMPIFFNKLFSTDTFICIIKVFIAFCLISSVVYIFNDIIDKKIDKLHPVKKNRPIASDKIKINYALFLALLFLILGIFLVSFNLKLRCIILAYIFLNLLYSLKIKNYFILDAISIALGFILRVLAGYIAVKAPVSAVIILLVFITSLFFTFIKRNLEISAYNEILNYHNGLNFYSSSVIQYFIPILGLFSCILYILTVFSIKEINNFLFITIIPYLLIASRIIYLVKNYKTDNPINFFEKDKIIKILCFIYVFILVLTQFY